MLFLELHLPPNGDLNAPKSKKTLGYTRRGGGRVRLGKQFSTTKVTLSSSPFRVDCDEDRTTAKLSKWCWQDVLQKLCPLHPLPGVILEWRRITNALTKVVFPLQREKRYQPMIKMDRIYPVAQTHTATGRARLDTCHSDICSFLLITFLLLRFLLPGRVSFTEPNIQNVPKDFEICMPTVVGESPPSQDHVTPKPGWVKTKHYFFLSQYHY